MQEGLDTISITDVELPVQKKPCEFSIKLKEQLTPKPYIYIYIYLFYTVKTFILIWSVCVCVSHFIYNVTH